MQIFHIATAADWRQARRSGGYQTSTRGRTLEQEGFIHASHRDQVGSVFTRYYRGVREPLVLLTIQTDLLPVPWREDVVGGESFPHIYGSLTPAAVVNVEPLDARGRPASFTMLFLQEMLRRIVPAIIVMFLAVLCSEIGRSIDPDRGPVIGALAGLVLGGSGVVALARLRSRG